ncbi:hypothetical protein AOE01nite_29810 [Acetobacter oeni]|uniref:Uncharacterized protein n=1 Tax=Acetobacter oeni TaxID=304077 RepID=A0A511XP90_9PROT|nr:hypothetical protein AA21952_1147 [Acetobacter oeni LMG 21952]GEN64757.1 hypothetical protein AOE01nite_29810 [Acetobacter oeni]
MIDIDAEAQWGGHADSPPVAFSLARPAGWWELQKDFSGRGGGCLFVDHGLYRDCVARWRDADRAGGG